MLKKSLVCLALILCGTLVLAQIPDDGDIAKKNDKKSSFTTVFEGTPGKAALYSLLIPGAGQIYNGRWWKAPIVWGAEGITAYFLIDNIQTFNRWNTCYESLVLNEPPDMCGSVTDSSQAFSLRQTARSNRELAWVFMGLVHLLNAVEAFVDRHLINFDTSEELSVDFGRIHRSDLTGYYSVDLLTVQIPLRR